MPDSLEDGAWCARLVSIAAASSIFALLSDAPLSPSDWARSKRSRAARARSEPVLNMFTRSQPGSWLAHPNRCEASADSPLGDPGRQSRQLERHVTNRKAMTAGDPHLARVDDADLEQLAVVIREGERVGRAVSERDIGLDVGLVKNHDPLVGMVLDLAAV